jgi:hypothetical protein
MPASAASAVVFGGEFGFAPALNLGQIGVGDPAALDDWAVVAGAEMSPGRNVRHAKQGADGRGRKVGAGRNPHIT